MLFRRLFPRESPWFGFFVPALTLVLVLNFIEHQIAVPSLKALLPFTTVGSLWLMVSPKTNWRRLRMPAIIFVSVYAVTLTLRFLKPDISNVRDGMYDLQFVSSFCMGQSLPAESTWIPPLKLIYYYAFGHYGCSVLIRYFGVDLGTGFNMSAALVSAWIYFLIAGIAWQITRRKRWFTILAPILAICSGTGSTGYLWLVLKDVDPEDTAELLSRFDNNETLCALYRYLDNAYLYDRHELLVPGWWAWMGILHSTSIGQFITLIVVLSLGEMVRRKQFDWPWICCCACAPLMLVSSTWGFPFVTLLVVTGLAWCWYMKRTPRNPRFVILALGAVAICLTPMLLYYTTSSVPPHNLVYGGQHTQVVEFLVQWWPVFLPYLAMLFTCRRAHPVVGIILVVAPIAFTLVEIFNVGARFDMTGKIWGFIYCAAWATLVPAIAVSRYRIFHVLFALIVINSALSLCYWTTYYRHTIDQKDLGNLEGKGDLRFDQPKARILNALLPIRNQVIFAGTSAWSFSSSARIANFSGNRDYVTWSFNCDNDMFRNGVGEGLRRETAMNDFYAGKNPDPLLFLRSRNIAAVVIYPDDNISNEVIEKLKKALSPSYPYEDLREDGDHDSPNCGIFIYHPDLLNGLPGDAISVPAKGN